ncbi:hypothetical protein HK100_004749 [Physocladia obscura]|uniref:Uncharacterized protein n=1 Tax=Physocladia obscura TaxID=109957 RepID=A0AAD5T9V0_9FUNG|nr:hypothetical protein HK100_004749 [Physocladia obscura]
MEIYRIICSLCDSAMNRLVKGAETSIIATSDMFAKSNANGDLASGSGGGVGGGNVGANAGISNGRVFSRTQHDKIQDEDFENNESDDRLREILDEEDFSAMRASNVDLTSPLTLNLPYSDHLEKSRNLTSNRDSDDLNSVSLTKFAANSSMISILHYAHTNPSTCLTTDALNTQLKNLEFRTLFLLPICETITLSEAQSGKIMAPGQSQQQQQNQQHLPSLIHAGDNAPNIIFSIPFQSIGAIHKQITLPGQAQNFAGMLVTTIATGAGVVGGIAAGSPAAGGSTNGWVSLYLKNGKECWLSIAGPGRRDAFVELLSRGVKAAGVGEIGVGEMEIIGNSPTALPTTPIQRNPNGQNFNRTGGGDAQWFSKDGLLLIGLKFLFEREWKDGVYTYPDGDPKIDQAMKDEEAGRSVWKEYFNANGNDVSMFKDLNYLRQLIIKANGVPHRLRGGFWMMCTGSWHVKPEPDYYLNLVKDHLGVPSPFMEEIEKDVRRSLPEHPAYQSKIGIDALRRILTSYSWRNLTIGYAQALNIISAVLMLYLKEEDAFWVLCGIVERILPDHYTKTLVGSVIDQSVFNLLVKSQLPALTTHMDKLYMELSTISVPWFVCLFLNNVALSIGIRILDGFFLDGPKFLFWIAIAVLKINESELIARGRDDDIFMQIIKNFFERLAADDTLTDGDHNDNVSETQPVNDTKKELIPSDVSEMKGQKLFSVLLTVAYSFSNYITAELIETLRSKCRLSVVHQMENSSRRSQVRSLEEQVSMSFDEVAVVYDSLRTLEFNNEETELALLAPVGPATSNVHTKLLEEKREEDQLRLLLINAGAWGLVARKRKPSSAAVEKSAQTANEISSTATKTIKLTDFRKVFQKVSPWKSSTTILSSSQLPSPKTITRTGISAINVPRGLSAVRNSAASTSTIGVRNSFSSVSSVSLQTQSVEDLHICLVDRIYFYSSFNYNSFHASKAIPQGGLGADYMKSTNGQLKASSQASYIVDLASLVHTLDIMLKQPLNTRLRFLFDLHDIDGDGFLDKAELKAVMDSMLEMFEQSKSDGKNEDEEVYMKAVSSFLNSALKLGSSKSSTVPTIDQGFQRENDEEGTMSEESNKTVRNFQLSRSASSYSESQSSIIFRDQTHTRALSSPTQQTEFRLSFNEFLLAVLSQTVFVQFFERVSLLSLV